MLKKCENKDLANYVIIENKSLVELHGVKPGKRIKLKANRNGMPLDLHWRRRLRDSAIDKSVEIVTVKNQPEKNTVKNMVKNQPEKNTIKN